MINVKLNLLLEIAIRGILWWLFMFYDGSEPFLRHIKPNELWKYQYPVTPSIVSAKSLWLTIFLYPIVFLAIEFYITGKLDDPMAAVMGLTLGYSLNGFLTSFMKVVIGRPRPDFYFRCFPNGIGDDYTKCTGTRRNYLDGRKSFPSGHSSFAFTSMVFMSVYMARKFHLFDKSKKGHSWQLCVCVIPIFIATLIAVSRTCDYHHHYEDIIGGALLGSTISCLCYRLYFPSTTEVE
ncbi:phosphatidate phosphatase PPAPDC1A [Asbolus verrucosus]|uniref:Phosphatidate phosphatase PPAPDC1A n=1 Tax=Asbolus verrucosus TaxID=1661398 RepID=A0A482W7C6_ASBVE|nr:phosphatidate phosphatase PPAPDC1A [Asbolus verrucosus]